MNANRKVILIVILGTGACLLTFMLSQHFSKKNQENQLLLSQVQQLSGRVEYIRLLSKNFIQSGDRGIWQKIIKNLEIISLDLDAAPHANLQWKQEIHNLENILAEYYILLTRIHQPAIRLNEEKIKLQGIGLSFSMEVENNIIKPYRKDEGTRLYEGNPIDPFKTRVKETAYDVIGLHLQQQLILLELLLDWDIPGYKNKKRDIADGLEKQKTQLHYMNILMGNDPDIENIIGSLDKRLTSLVHQEQVIIEHFSTLTKLNQDLTAAGDRLVEASENLSEKIVSEISYANKLNRNLSWGLLIGILTGLSILGAMLARDIIRFVADLKTSQENLKASESNLEITLNSLGDAVIATNDKGLITRMNPSAERLTGWPSTEAIGRPLPEVFSIINSRTREKAANPVEKVLTEGKTVGLANHTVLIAKNGNEYQIADSGAPIRDADGRILGVVLVFRDVTESYIQEQRIRENERRLQEITANVPGVVYQFESTLEHAYTNSFISENAYKIFGLEANADTFFNDFLDHIPDNDNERFITSVRQAVDRVIPWHYEGRFIKSDGTIIWFSGDSIPQKAEDKIIFYGVLLDTTRQKQLEESLRLAQFCIDKASIGIFRIGEEGQILSANEQACRTLGYTNDELINMKVFDIDPNFSPKNWPEHIDYLKKIGTKNIETLHQHKNGSLYPVQIVINLMTFEDREFHIAFVQDISERKKWENELEASERRYRDLFNEAPVMYVITEDRNGSPHIIDANHLFLELLGHDRRDVIGTPLIDYYTAESRQKLIEDGGFQRALNGQFVAEERSLVTHDDRIIHTLLHALPEKDSNDRVVGTRAMFLDITDRKKTEKEAKRLEAALMQSQKMEAIGTLAGGIAHDFNNILAAVIGYTELSLTMTEEGSRLHHNLEEVNTAGLRARDLVRQILTFSRKHEREFVPVQIGPLVKEALKLLRSSLPTTIDIIQEVDPNLDNVLADPTQIHQIVMNLCTNAAHAMEVDGGLLNVSLSQVRLSERDVRMHPGLLPADYLKLTIQDTGTGIPPEIQEKIFDPYFTTKEKDRGTGLGLAVVHGIVQSYGGGIYVYSEPGKGTIFNVYFPTIKKQIFAGSEVDQGLPPGGNEHILLVDDEQILVTVGRLTLEKLGYKVSTATGSDEALEVFKSSPQDIDLVITDMTMPKMTGDKLAVELMKIRSDIPIILTTGYSTKISREKALKIGIKAFLEKPVVEHKLANILREILDGSNIYQ